MFKVRISQNKELIQLEKPYYLRRSANIWGLSQSLLSLPPQILLPAEAAGWDPSKLPCLHHPQLCQGIQERDMAASEVTVIIREDLFQYVLETIWCQAMCPRGLRAPCSLLCHLLPEAATRLSAPWPQMGSFSPCVHDCQYMPKPS